YSSQNQNLLYRVTEDPGFTTPYTANEYKYSIDDYFNPSFLRKIFSSTLQIDHQLSDDVALTAITAQFFSYNRGITDFAKKPIPIDLLFQNADHRVYSQEIRLGSTGHGDLDWLVGAFAQNPHLTAPQLTGHEFSPRASLQYKLSPRTNVYGTIARGFEPADLVEQNFRVTPIRPEIATSYEVGVKSQLARGAQFTAAVFYI